MKLTFKAKCKKSQEEKESLVQQSKQETLKKRCKRNERNCIKRIKQLEEARSWKKKSIKYKLSMSCSLKARKTSKMCVLLLQQSSVTSN